VPRHPAGLIPFPFGFPLRPHGLSAFFFSVFLCGKLMGFMEADGLKRKVMNS
jgi:hypothetical protein